MEFSISTLLSNFTDDKLVAAKFLEKKLGCLEETNQQKLQIALDALEKIGILVKERGKYRRVFEEGVVEAKLRCSSKGFGFAIQNVEGAADIYVRESNLSSAWNGDRVLVRITKEGNRRRSPEGEVRLILERSHPSVLARVKQTSAGYRAVPLDDRLLFELELQPNGTNLEQAIDHLVDVEIVRYPLGQYPPIGRVTQVLGSDAEAAADIDIVCCKHDLPRNFSNAVLAAASELDYQKIRKINQKNRLDLRYLFTLTIASEAKLVSSDRTPFSLVEQALTLERMDAERWRVGVHIADVAIYVEQSSLLDREAQRRGTSVVLNETIVPLLPPSLLQQASLLPGQDRLAISVLLTLDRLGQVIEFEIQPTIIQVDDQLSESQARAIFARHEQGVSAEIKELTPVFATLDQLLVLSMAINDQRKQRGAIELDLPEEDTHFNDEGAMSAMVNSSGEPARSTIANLMILVNEVMANHLKALGVPTMYRVQPPPDLDNVQELIKVASNLRLELQPEQEEAVTAQDYQRFIQQFALTGAQRVLNSLLQSTLKPAVYSTTPGAHFSMALTEGYTHGISAGRRYADLLVQRVLHAVFEQGRSSRTTRTKEQVNLRHSSCWGNITWNVLPPGVQQELEEHLVAVVVSLNELEKEAQEAEADLAGLKKAELMKERIGEVLPGSITGVQSYGFFVEVEVPIANSNPFRVEGLVHVSSLKDDWYEYRARQEALVGRKNRKQYRLGDRVEVQVKSVDYYRQQIDLVTVDSNGNGDDRDPDESPFFNLDDE